MEKIKLKVFVDLTNLFSGKQYIFMANFDVYNFELAGAMKDLTKNYKQFLYLKIFTRKVNSHYTVTKTISAVCREIQI